APWNVPRGTKHGASSMQMYSAPTSSLTCSVSVGLPRTSRYRRRGGEDPRDGLAVRTSPCGANEAATLESATTRDKILQAGQTRLLHVKHPRVCGMRPGLSGSVGSVPQAP